MRQIDSQKKTPLRMQNVWHCRVCTFDNLEELNSCDICGVIRHESTISESTERFDHKKSAASALARSLFAPLPRGKLKKSGVVEQLQDSLTMQRNGKLQGTFRELRSFFVSEHENKHCTIEPFKFDNPSPDDVFLARRKNGNRGTENRATKQVLKSTPKSTESTARVPNFFPEEDRKKDIRCLDKNDPAKEVPEDTAGSMEIVAKLHNSLSEEDRTKEKICSQQLLPCSTDHLEIMDTLKLSHSRKEDRKVNGCNQKSLPLDTYKPEQWILERLGKESKQPLHLAVIGHVDAGKSTIMGCLLHLLGHVSQKDIHKYEKEATAKGKSSSAYAWILDEGAEERSRGVTMAIAIAHFETPKFQIVLLDTPGHRDFVPNMISGASQADAAILVIDASIGAFEAGMEGECQSGGQTKEHLQIVRSSGVEQIILAVNKMDTVEYSEERFTIIKRSLRPFLRQCGFKDSATKWIPLSAIGNQNLMARSTEARLKSWYLGPTLFEAINTFEPVSRNDSKPLRMPIAELPKIRGLGQAAVSGKLEGGAIKVGMKVLVMPANVTALVKSMESNGKPLSWGRAGDSIDIALQGVDPTALMQGGVLCHPSYPVSVTSHMEAKILLLDVPMPILRGAQVVIHCHQAKEAARIVELISVVDQRSGTILRTKPRCLTAHQSAFVEIVTEGAVCVEEYLNFKALGRITLRDAGKTLAVGIVSRVLA